MSGDGEEEHNQLLLLTAALFAVRLFRSDEEPSLTHLSVEQRKLDEEGDAGLREEAAQRAALDAAAIIAAVAKVEEL